MSPARNLCVHVFEYGVLKPDDFGLSDRHYRIRGHQLSEVMPDRCPAGHPLGKNSSVGSYQATMKSSSTFM